MFKRREKIKDSALEMEETMDNMAVDIPDIETVKKPKKKLPGWVIIPIVGVVVLAFFLLSKLGGGNEGGMAQLNTVEVKTGDVKEVYHTSGIVESERTKVFYSPVNAPINTCGAKVGEVVKTGEVLIAFDTTNLERDNRQAGLNTLSAVYTNQEAIEQSGQAAQSAAAAQAQSGNAIVNLQNQIYAKQEEINGLQSTAAAASADAAKNALAISGIQQQMQSNLDEQSQQKAVKENADRELAKITSGDPNYDALMTEAENATLAISQLEIAYRSLENQLGTIGAVDASGAGAALAAASQELAGLQANLAELQNSSGGSTVSGIGNAQRKNMQVSEELAELSQLSTEELLAKGREGIKAEFDGIISDVKALEGSDAMMGGELFTLVSNQDVGVSLEVSANDFDKLAIGSKAEIKVGQKVYHGTLTAIDKIALTNEKGNPVIGAKIHIDDVDDEIYIGVGAKVSMTVAEKKSVLCLPNEVVNTSTDGDFVYLIKDGIVKKQEVELGVASSTEVEVVSGLEEGQQVVSDVSGNVTEGMKAIGTASEE